jgi:hypothetical protein
MLYFEVALSLCIWCGTSRIISSWLLLGYREREKCQTYLFAAFKGLGVEIRAGRSLETHQRLVSFSRVEEFILYSTAEQSEFHQSEQPCF